MVGSDLADNAISIATNGGSVLLLGTQYLSQQAMERLGLEEASASAPPRPVSPSFGGLPEIDKAGLVRATATDSRWIPLVVNKQKGFALARRYGKGWVFACSSADAFQNDTISAPGHADFVMRLISVAAMGAKKVEFDEYMHGYAHGELWDRIGLPGRATAWQLLLVFGVIVFSVGRRLGYPLARRVKPPALGEYVGAIAQLYERAEAPGLALRTIRKQGLRRAAQIAGLPLGADEKRLLGKLPAGLRDALDDMDSAASGDVSPDVAAKLCRNLDRELAAFHTSRHGAIT